MGKSTFCAKFCQDWALVVKEKEGQGQELTEEQKSELEQLTEEQTSKLNSIGLLIFIVLRDIDEGLKTIDDIMSARLGLSFKSQPGFEKHLTDVLEINTEHRYLTLLLDGFDEMSYNDELINCVTKGDSYQNLHCITTCRPYATHGIVLNVDVEIRLKGFSPAQAKYFVEMFARIKYNDQNQIESFVRQTMSLIESSADLLEMSTNPSMLQLLCLLSWKKGKISKDRTSVFKYYSDYLLMQYHIKLGKKVKSYSADLYHQDLLDAGKVALRGLRQNQLKLIFSKSEAHQIGGDAIFDIGFLTEFSSTDIDSVKVQFTHKTLQEYLAAFYVVNTPGDEGLQLLMEFCSTSQRLMGSQIILEFVSNLSTKMGKEIQKKIMDYVSTWDSDDKVDPKSRTSFLISMLEGIKTLTFPLPAVVDIDLREYDHAPGVMSFLPRLFSRCFKMKKSTLDQFLDMDGHGVKQVNLTLGKHKRLKALKNTNMENVKEFCTNYCNSWSKEDGGDLCGLMKKINPGELHITSCERKLIEKATIDVILQHVHILILKSCNLQKEDLLLILQEVIYMFGKDVTLLHNAATMKSLSICNCGIQIDTEIAEAVSRLPDDIQLDLSGNKLTKMEPRLLPGVLAHMPKDKEIDMTEWGITIEIVRALSKMPQLKSLNASCNILTPEAAREFSMSQLQQLDLRDCGISDNVCVPLMISLSEHCPLLEDLSISNNKLATDKWCHYV